LSVSVGHGLRLLMVFAFFVALFAAFFLGLAGIGAFSAAVSGAHQGGVFSGARRAVSVFSPLCSAPDARAYFLLLRQKKVAKEKAPLVGGPFGASLRYSDSRAAG
jgi:hypothetical protein